MPSSNADIAPNGKRRYSLKIDRIAAGKIAAEGAVAGKVPITSPARRASRQKL
jgi:hypothetical protein